MAVKLLPPALPEIWPSGSPVWILGILLGSVPPTLAEFDPPDYSSYT